MCLCICAGMYVYICIHVSTYVGMDMSVYTYITSLHTICASPSGGQLHSLGSRLQLDRAVSLPRAFLPRALSGCYFGPSLLFFQCHIHVAIVYTRD